MFTKDELGIMDAPTADSEVVLASMGGKPRVRGEKAGEEDGETEAESEGNGVKWEGWEGGEVDRGEGGKEERGEGGKREVGSGGLRGRKGGWGGDEEDV